MTSPTRLEDSFGRTVQDLRISVTDRCNFRCLYCLPETEAAANFYRGRFHGTESSDASKPITHTWKPKSQFLEFEEIERVVRLAAGFGVNKIRITGGEPLLRPRLEELIARITSIPGMHDVAITTNGTGFLKKGKLLRDAGLHRVSFSLDSLDRENFKRVTGRDGLQEVLESIQWAKELGLSPVKVNAVIIRELNDHEIEPLAEFARDHELSMRFIEFMPLDSQRTWKKHLVIPGTEMLERLQKRHTLTPLPAKHPSETSKRWRFQEGNGEVGIIAPVTEPFCGNCNRIRLTADGQIRTCLFSLVENDLKPMLRNGNADAEIEDYLRKVVWKKEERHHIGEDDFVQPSRPMSSIGG